MQDNATSIACYEKEKAMFSDTCGKASKCNELWHRCPDTLLSHNIAISTLVCRDPMRKTNPILKYFFSLQGRIDRLSKCLAFNFAKSKIIFEKNFYDVMKFLTGSGQRSSD